MSTLTDQEYFTKTIAHLLTQGAPCIDDNGFCVYNNAEGMKCAVGYWLPEWHEAETTLGGMHALSTSYPELVGISWPDTVDGYALALELQMLHDNTKMIDDENINTFKGERFNSAVERIRLRFDLN